MKKKRGGEKQEEIIDCYLVDGDKRIPFTIVRPDTKQLKIQKN